MIETPSEKIITDLEVLIFAPTGQDAKLIEQTLKTAGIESNSYANVQTMRARLTADAGAVVIAEEALNEEAIKDLKETLSAQEAWSDLPIIVMTSSGETTAMSIRVMNNFSADGNVTLMERPFRRTTLVSMVQVALRSRKRQYEVRELLKKQIEATKMRDEFISIAGHELKTPLTSLKLETQINQRIIKRSGPDEFPLERVQRLVDNTDRQVNKLSRLVEDMLDVSRAITGKLAIEKKVIDLSALVEEVIDGMRLQLASANCDLSLKLVPKLMVSADSYRIEQVINNLLTNVIRYAPAKPVKVKTESVECHAMLIVQDEGSGISPANQTRIFERFERAVTSGHISGLGLGLYICREIVEAHSGTIWVESKEGRGSKFVVKLPIQSV